MSKTYVGRFSEQDISAGKDKVAVESAMLKTSLKYTDTELVKRNGKIIAMDIWVCNISDFKKLLLIKIS